MERAVIDGRRRTRGLYIEQFFAIKATPLQVTALKDNLGLFSVVRGYESSQQQQQVRRARTT